MALVPAAAIAGTAAAAAYLDAKLHITKDLKSLYNLKATEWSLAKAAKLNRWNLWYYFEDTVNRLPPNEEAIWSQTGCYTFRQTYDQSCRYGQFFLSQGVNPKQLVATYLTNSPEFVFNWLGQWSIGAAPAMINHHLTGDALIHCVRLSGAKIMIVDEDVEVRARMEENRARLEGELGVRIIILDGETRARINAQPAVRPPNDLRNGSTPTDPMSLFYTSGSTGHPKAVSYSNGRTISLGGKKNTAIGIKGGPNGDRWYNCMPMYHGTGGVVVVTCMLVGITLCIGKKFSTSRFWNEIRMSNATAFVYVGETARYLVAAPPSPKDKDHKVRVMFGNGLRPDVWKRFQDRFGIDTVAEFFNSTEGVFGLLNVCRGPFLQKTVGHHGAIMRYNLRDYYVAAEIDHETGDLWRDPKTGFGKRRSLEEGGEMIVGVPQPELFAGYWNNPDATKKKFARNLFKKGDLWYRSGDALRRDREGRWFFMDRLGDTYRWKSENVATAEVSETLGNCPQLLEAIVYGVAIPGHDGKAGMAAINLEPTVNPTPETFRAILQYAQERLPKYAIPVFLRLQSEFNAMHNQKQNKVPLKKDAINLDAIYGPGRDAEGARREGKDVLYWWPGALGHPNPGLDGESYIVFDRKDYEGLMAHGKEVARL
ncbi:acetyl-CoA synthetase-like protein [Tothia fuscella]|uniref:Very long-chain fatty acid transport protein n=1 Tax=Tothia fuscella TaxID=1048955 RepID=A0A9P4NRK2_9PEZI|nr:acetyl-CoA synthetase-like protein [Tothia fuscella]